ncbi:PD-(D/E)XK nuclease family protein [Spirulina sp. CCNP1310]|uniref:PD-(D/E)XK nuclease family protein n=1 Tax=Spirulina sp. CCNP1310 TaxID=3110249 RepID=UPI002B1FA827|nr:PD-(D/E)XK nuclease family protein [Spirulina sp. CCNP1310]MEA5421481.1 PD-(D/E)XK nuclease family protein [Spirulina sp. CCNP1310]
MSLLRLSQGHLNTFTKCPRRYQYQYIDQLNAPISPHHQAQLDRGSRLHQLMQQRELGLPLETILNPDDPLKAMYDALLTAVPDLTDASISRAAEQSRTLVWDGVALTVVYDLLMVKGDRAFIFDWKTYQTAPPRSILQQNWQTQLYPFVLAATSNYAPEQITMAYWIVGNDNSVQAEIFDYDQQWYQQTQGHLRQSLMALEMAQAAYQDQGIPFPQVHQQNAICRSCPFQSPCQRQETVTISPLHWRQLLVNQAAPPRGSP